MDVREKVANDAYKSKLEILPKPRPPAVLNRQAKDLTTAEADSLNQVKQDYDDAVAKYRQSHLAYRQDQARLDAEFRADLLNEHNIDPASKLGTIMFDRAWEYGHSNGYNEVMMAFEDLVPIVEAARSGK